VRHLPLLALLACTADQSDPSTDTPGDPDGPLTDTDTDAPVDPCDDPPVLCADGTCTADVALTTIELSGTFTLNGDPLAIDDDDDQPYLLLRRGDQASNLPLGWEDDRYVLRTLSGPSQSVDINWRAPAFPGPVTGTLPAVATFDGTADAMVDLAVTAPQVTGTITVDGVTPSGWSLSGVGTTAGGWSLDGGDADLDAIIPDGSWDLRFEAGEVDGEPVYGRPPIASAWSPAAGTLDVAATSAQVTIRPTLNGASASWSELRYVADGDRDRFAYPGNDAPRFLHGQYDLEVYVTGTDDHVGGRFVIAEDLVLDGDVELSPDFEMHRVHGTLSFPTVQPDPAYRLEFRDGERSYLSEPLQDPAFDLLVPEGTWDIRLRPSNAGVGPMVPARDATIATDVAVTAETELDLELPLTRITGRFAVGGEPIGPDPDGFYNLNYYSLTLKGETDNLFIASYTDAEPYAIVVPPGVYQVDAYVHAAGNTLVASGYQVVHTDLDVPDTADDVVVDIDLPVVPMDVSLTVDGAPIADDRLWSFNIRRLGEPAAIRPGGSSTRLFTGPQDVTDLYPGRYDLIASLRPDPSDPWTARGAELFAACVEVR
jgi:hypothetical protein